MRFVLSAAAVAAAMLVSADAASALSTAGLLGYYDFENSDGADSSGNANDGVVGSAVTFTAPGGGVGGGIAARTAVINGGGRSAGFIRLPIDVNASALPEVTFGAWVNPASGGKGKVFSHDNGGFDRTLGIDSRGGGLGWSAFTGSAVLGSSPAPFALNEWTFIAASYDGATVTLTVGDQQFTAVDNTDFNVGLTLLALGGNPSYNENFDGAIDNAFVFSRVLSLGELNEIRVNGLSTAVVPLPATLPLFAGALGLLGWRRWRR